VCKVGSQGFGVSVGFMVRSGLVRVSVYGIGLFLCVWFQVEGYGMV